jgi:hypothetical protein
LMQSASASKGAGTSYWASIAGSIRSRISTLVSCSAGTGMLSRWYTFVALSARTMAGGPQGQVCLHLRPAGMTNLSFVRQ